MMREHRKYYDVVPAKAGTHNHQLCYFRRMSRYNRIQGVWVPAFAGTTQDVGLDSCAFFPRRRKRSQTSTLASSELS